MSKIRKFINGTLSELNSSSVVLGAGATFTGQGEDVTEFVEVRVAVYSDVGSAVDGLTIEYSTDKTNWDHDDAYTVPANTGKNYGVQRVAKYYRVVYVNGGAGQASFRLSTILNSVAGMPSSHRIQDSISSDDDAVLVKSVLTGEDPDGIFRNAETTSDGVLKVSDESSGLSIAEGDVTGKSFIHKFGASPDFDSTDLVVSIWDGANDGGIDEMQYNYSTTAAIDSISSSDNGDTQEIEILGLDSNYLQVTQTKVLQGQTRVALDTSIIRVFRMRNIGSVDMSGQCYCYENTAIVAGAPTDTTKVRAIINDGNNQTEMALYTIPAGKTGYMRSWFASAAGAKKITNYIIRIKARPFGQVFQSKHPSAITETVPYQHKYEEPEIFETKTDIEITCALSDAGITDAAVSGGFDIVLVDD